MALAAGRLRHRVTIQRPVKVKDPVFGDFHDSWQDVATVWAGIEALSAREFIAAQSTQSQVSTRIIIRFREGVDATMRIVHKSKIYNIAGVLADKNSGREYLTLPVSEGVNNG